MKKDSQHIRFEQFVLSKRVTKYCCGCKEEIFNFEKVYPLDRCEKHDKSIMYDKIIVDSL